MSVKPEVRKTGSDAAELELMSEKNLKVRRQTHFLPILVTIKGVKKRLTMLVASWTA